jgi:putative transposase
METNHGRGYVYYLKYHIVFCVKYRHQVLKNQIEQDLSHLFLEIAESNGFQIETMEIMPDHVHMLVSRTPQNYIPDLLNPSFDLR